VCGDDAGRSPFRRSKRAVVTLVTALSVAVVGCADPQETARRGQEELVRHRDDPLLSVSVPGLRVVSSSSTAAYVDQGPIFKVPFSTEFVRRFAPFGVDAERGFELLKFAVGQSGARFASSACSVRQRGQEALFSASSKGDDTTVAVVFTPDNVGAPLELHLRVASTGRSSSTGMADCLRRQLGPGAFVSAYADRPRSDIELCALLTEDVRRSVFDGQIGSASKVGCTMKGSNNGRRAFVQMGDLRTTPLVDLLDRASPGTDPNAVRIDSGSGPWWTDLPRLRTGALRVTSDSQAVLDAVVEAILANDSRAATAA
jgi:hypothetical protein